MNNLRAKLATLPEHNAREDAKIKSLQFYTAQNCRTASNIAL